MGFVCLFVFLPVCFTWIVNIGAEMARKVRNSFSKGTLSIYILIWLNISLYIHITANEVSGESGNYLGILGEKTLCISYLGILRVIYFVWQLPEFSHFFSFSFVFVCVWIWGVFFFLRKKSIKENNTIGTRDLTDQILD